MTKVRKRDGRVVEFEPKKTASAIYKAFSSVGKADMKLAEKLAGQAMVVLGERFANKVPGVEDVQDAVETVLINGGYADVAKAFILYRWKRTEERDAKHFLGVEDVLKLSVNAIRVLRRRYFKKDERGNPAETPAQMFRRVANAVAAPDGKQKGGVEKAAEEFYHLMASLEFLPNSPTLMNAGTPIGQLAACFVLPVPDSMEGIFDALKNAALIHQSGGGVGYSFSHLRPKGDRVKSTMGVASGPLSFMRVFDMATDVVKQGGRRRGANMGILAVTHPDVLEFATAKGQEGFLQNFNLSISATDEFMKAVAENEEYPLVNPRAGTPVKWLKARDVFDLVATMAWRTGDPGMVFIDEINRHNPTPAVGAIEATNPCGEQPLLPFESCVLGSVNAAKAVSGKKIDWAKLRKNIHSAMHFLDNVIDVTKFPTPQTEKIVKANRKIGLGVMGFADMLIRLGIPYDSPKALQAAEKLMAFVARESKNASADLAKKRGKFPNFGKSIWKKKFTRLRNATTNTIAPTGTISIIANCSSGIEPLFAVAFVREVMDGTRLLEVSPEFEAVARKRKFYSKELMMKIAKRGSVQGMREVPKDVQRLFVTALDIAPEWHVRMQAAFQKHVDNAVSKTVNLKRDATVEDVKKIYLLAHELKCKGITVYRYGSRKEQVLYIGAQEEMAEEDSVRAGSEYSGGCPAGECVF
ncbi:MAG: adenosylcobalamin-dependent ribonucleoside-diphosphate reductase [Candidatus Micrarchaeota archaeon]|nr:adenosylcobalamin-dependent ribonucleoside-diphosphate reductase [Candidatus Micrarchaeota archaeon]